MTLVPMPRFTDVGLNKNGCKDGSTRGLCSGRFACSEVYQGEYVGRLWCQSRVGQGERVPNSATSFTKCRRNAMAYGHSPEKTRAKAYDLWRLFPSGNNQQLHYRLHTKHA